MEGGRRGWRRGGGDEKRCPGQELVKSSQQPARRDGDNDDGPVIDAATAGPWGADKTRSGHRNKCEEDARPSHFPSSHGRCFVEGGANRETPFSFSAAPTVLCLSSCLSLLVQSYINNKLCFVRLSTGMAVFVYHLPANVIGGLSKHVIVLDLFMARVIAMLPDSEAAIPFFFFFFSPSWLLAVVLLVRSSVCVYVQV